MSNYEIYDIKQRMDEIEKQVKAIMSNYEIYDIKQRMDEIEKQKEDKTIS